MKKLLAFILALATVLSLSVCAFAEPSALDENDATAATGKGEGNYSIGANGIYQAATGAAEQVSVEIAWNNMKFTYDAGDKGTWKPGDHTYENGKPGQWKEETATITVTNHSNIAIGAEFTFTSAENLGIIGKFNSDYILLESANDTKYQTNTGTNEDPVYDAPKAEVKFSIDPESPAINKAEATLGTITVKLAKFDPTVPYTFNASGEEGWTWEEHEAIAAKMQSRLTAVLKFGVTDITVTFGNKRPISDDAYYKFVAIRAALEDSKVADGTIDLTIKGVTYVEEYFLGEHRPANTIVPAADKLKSITLPDVTRIDGAAFYSCTKLEKVDAPKLEIVGETAFCGCESLASIDLSKVTTVGAWAFYGCAALTSLDLPFAEYDKDFDGLETFWTAFRECTSLTTAHFGALTKVPGKMLDECGNLTRITFDKPLTWVAADGLNLGYIYTSAGPVNIAPNVTLVLAAGQKEMVKDSSGAYVEGENLVTGGVGATFCGVKFKEVIVPTELTGETTGWETAISAAFNATTPNEDGSYNLAFALPANIDETAFKAFVTALNGNADLQGKKVKLTLRGVKEIPSNAFNLYQQPLHFKLTEIDLPDATSIENSAFLCCSTLTAVYAPNVTKIADDAFEACSGLKSVYLPKVTEVGYSAFSHCRALTSISMPLATKFGVAVFGQCSALAEAYLPALTDIAVDLFQGCAALKKLTLGAVTKVEYVTGYDALREVPTQNIDLVLSSSQKVMTKNSNNYWVAGEADYKGSAENTNNSFLGSTFKSIAFHD